jgi:hypothetical protein
VALKISFPKSLFVEAIAGFDTRFASAAPFICDSLIAAAHFGGRVMPAEFYHFNKALFFA